MATGKKFTEVDERRAVARFRSWEEQSIDNRVEIPNGPIRYHTFGDATAEFDMEQPPHKVKSAQFWSWLREQLIEQPEYIGKMTGIPELAILRHLPLPKAAIKIQGLIDLCEQNNPSTSNHKRRVVATFRKLADFAEAKTLDDLPQATLKKHGFRRIGWARGNSRWSLRRLAPTARITFITSSSRPLR